jgi:hypothetical protein
VQPSNDTTVAGAVALILVWVLDLVHIEMPPAVATVVLAALAGYLAPTQTSHNGRPNK